MILNISILLYRVRLVIKVFAYIYIYIYHIPISSNHSLQYYPYEESELALQPSITALDNFSLLGVDIYSHIYL